MRGFEVKFVSGYTGSGKTAYTDRLHLDTGWPVLHIGDSLREFGISSKSISEMPDAHAPASLDKMVNQTVANFIAEALGPEGGGGVIIDGFPRKPSQVHEAYEMVCGLVRYAPGEIRLRFVFVTAPIDTRISRVLSSRSEARRELSVMKIESESADMDNSIKVAKEIERGKPALAMSIMVTETGIKEIYPGVMVADVLVVGDGYRMPVHAGDVGIDLSSNGRVEILPGEFSNVETGVSVKIDDRCWGRVTGRSSAVWGKGIMVMEGVIDPGYTGELFMLVYNPGKKAVVVDRGDRIAQLILIPRVDYSVLRVDSLPKTSRGNKGFGSTGK